MDTRVRPEYTQNTDAYLPLLCWNTEYKMCTLLYSFKTVLIERIAPEYKIDLECPYFFLIIG